MPEKDSRLNYGMNYDGPHRSGYYGACMVGGMLSCGITHTILCPIDVVKFNSAPAHWQRSVLRTMGAMIAEGGAVAVWKGWAPTAVGYGMQGCVKFGLYEYFKDLCETFAGPEVSWRYRGLIFLLSSASAEFVADVALCPMEMVKVQVQTSRGGTWPLGLLEATRKMHLQREVTRFPFGSLVPLWTRQIPYTMAKFYFFESNVEFAYSQIIKAPKSSCSTAIQMSVTAVSGCFAGVVCAILSQPADSVVSELGKLKNRSKGVGEIIAEVGLKDLLTKGLRPRVAMMSAVTGLQWLIYDAFKTACGYGTTGFSFNKQKS